MHYTGKQFPNIAVNSINYLGEEKMINIAQFAKENKRKVVLFWYPKDFTFVCPTEIHAFQEKVAEFDKKNTTVIGASVDSNQVHFAWLGTPKDKGGIEGVEFSILADTNRNLSSVLGILDADYNEENRVDGIVQKEGEDVTYRATYLIDEDGKVFHESVNDMPLGRNVDEYLRLIDAYTHVQNHGEVCPANWSEGEDAMKATTAGVADYLSNH